MEIKANRRQFIKTVSTTMLMSAVPISIGSVNLAKQINKTDCLVALIDAFIDDQERWAAHDPGYAWSREDGKGIADNLSDAFEIINPKTYEEYILVGACVWDATREYAAEYVRRKTGNPPILPDHPIFALDWRITPDTQRLLVFKEQIETLICVIMEPASRNERPYQKQFLRDEITFDRFSGRLEERYKKKLTQAEQMTIYRGLCHYVPNGQSYYWCSSIVNKALKKAGYLS